MPRKRRVTDNSLRLLRKIADHGFGRIDILRHKPDAIPPASAHSLLKLGLIQYRPNTRFLILSEKGRALLAEKK